MTMMNKLYLRIFLSFYLATFLNKKKHRMYYFTAREYIICLYQKYNDKHLALRKYGFKTNKYCYTEMYRVTRRIKKGLIDILRLE